ncbi:tetratricopeptide repeat protein [Henriciella aquimarina]|uniref:tetratricopeptide repeat protein n=1 Tax=Henriciella aquimarina TaxID=545261 RepID=UPI000A054E0D|nr:tetratricopeptide repeat protein [Henriciella aquimarina]
MREADLNARIAAARADAETSATADSYSEFLIARYASLTNDPEEAAQKYSLVARDRPDDQSIMERAVFSALLADDFSLARSISDKASDEVLQKASLPRITLAADALARGAHTQVPALLEGKDPGPFNGLVMASLRAWALFGAGHPGEAQLSLLDASQGDPYMDSLMLNMLGLLETASGEEASAIDTFSKLEASGTLVAITTVTYARLLASRDETGEALAVLNRFRENAGPNPAVSDLIRRIETGERVDTERFSARQGAARSVYIPAAALAERAGSDLPGVYYAIALHLDPDLQAARALWADALDTAGRRQEAISLLHQIPSGSPYATSAKGQLAWALRRSQQNEKALDFVRATLEGQPDRDVKIQMGDLLRSLGRDGEAAAVFTEIIKADATAGRQDWRLYYARGALRESMGLWPLAEEDLKTAMALNPDAPEVLNYLGYSWVDRGLHLEDGLDLIRRALTLRPDSGAITDSLGWAYYRLGEYEKAIGYLEAAVEMVPGLAEVNDHLGDAYWMTGRQTEARYQWQRAISLSEDSDEIERLQRKLLTGPTVHPVTAQQP